MVSKQYGRCLKIIKIDSQPYHFLNFVKKFLVSLLTFFTDSIQATKGNNTCLTLMRMQKAFCKSNLMIMNVVSKQYGRCLKSIKIDSQTYLSFCYVFFIFLFF